MHGASDALLVYVDLDHFKEINDTYGHAAGDQALQCVVEAMRQSFHQQDVLGRMGGDEFAIFCVCPEGQFSAIELRLKRKLAALSHGRRLPFQIDLSVGSFPCDSAVAGYTVDQLLVRADSLMYQNKSTKKGQHPQPVSVPAAQPA